MNHPEGIDDNGTHKSGSWTSKLTKSFKRHSRKSSTDERGVSREGGLDVDRSNLLHQMVATGSVPSTTRGLRGASMDQDRSRMGNTGTGNWPLPTTPSKSSAQQTSSTNSASIRAVEADVVGLDYSGRARRRSNDPGASIISGDGSVGGSPTNIKRKTVPSKGIADGSSTYAGESRMDPRMNAETGRGAQTGGALPISSQFLNKDGRTGQSGSGDATMALNKAKILLGSDSEPSARSNVTGLESDMTGLKLKSAESAGSGIPSAVEIIDRAGHDSAETITHKRMAPGMYCIDPI